MAYFEVVAARMVPRGLNPQGLSICAASIVEYGTDAQKERFVLPTLRGDITWCLGMSEPNAGSDLASLSTRAERRDGHFVVNGQKVWTSGAHDSDFCLCFVRTDHGGAEAPRHQCAHHRHADPGDHVPPSARADRPRSRRLQRGVLHGRGGAGGEPAWRAQSRMGGQPGLAAPRARHVVDHERQQDGARHPGPGAGGQPSRRARRHSRGRRAGGRSHRPHCHGHGGDALPGLPRFRQVGARGDVTRTPGPEAVLERVGAASLPRWPRRRSASRASTSTVRGPTG